MSGTPGAAPAGTDYRLNYQAELPEVMGRKLGLADAGVALGMGQTEYEAKHGAGSYPGYLAGQTLPQQGIVDFSQAQKRSQALAESGVGAYQDHFNRAAGYSQQAADPNAYKDFLNPYQDYVTQGIEDQFAKARNQANLQSVQAGAFGGARQGLQTAELARQQAEAVGTSLAQGYGSAQQMAQNVYGSAAQRELGQAGQQMNMGDISTLMQTGGQQQQLAQTVEDEKYRRAIQEMYEPYQRLGFVSDIMQGMPTSASSLAMATTPQANPLAQALGAGISGLALYQGYNQLANPTGKTTGN